MKKNYSPWNIKYDEFFKLSSNRDRLKFLIQFAVLAPSTHNSQPWKFEVEDNCIFIKANLERKLNISDPNNRHLYISLGCALENLLIAADYYGFQSDITYLQSEYKDRVIKVNFYYKAVKQPQQHLIFAINRRRSNRSKYMNQFPDQDLINNIRKLSSNNLQINIVDSEEEKNKIIIILMQFLLEAFSNKSFRSEMADYKRTNFTSSPLGMPGFTMGFGNIFSVFAPFFIRNFNIIKFLGKSEEDLLHFYTPIFLFVSTKDNNLEAWLNTGRTLQRIMLEAEQTGIQTAPRAVPLNVETLQKVLNTTYRPQIFLRMGYTTVIPEHSPRLEASEVIEE